MTDEEFEQLEKDLDAVFRQYRKLQAVYHEQTGRWWVNKTTRNGLDSLKR